MAGSEAASWEAVYHRRYQEELGYIDPLPTKLAMDNQAGYRHRLQPRAPREDEAHPAS